MPTGDSRVMVAMSGGVDSSVTAALLKNGGYQVAGVTMIVHPDGNKTARDAARVAEKLGIPHHIFDFRDVFTRDVITDFCREYGAGRTPNPCARCNRYIKFGALLDKAREMGADFMATGHYARVDRDTSGQRYRLKKGANGFKDQSYFLYALTQEQLGAALFPVGGLTKSRVRELAAEMGLTAADRPESQEICFIPDDDYAGFLRSHIPEAAEPGPILDEEDNALGTHNGIMAYTIGQRKGLGIAAATPRYVTSIEPSRNAIIVGNKAQVYSRELTATGLNWIAADGLERSAILNAKIRYQRPEAAAEVTPLPGGNVYVKFSEPQFAVTPGQAIVFYDEDTVIGGGIIEKVIRTAVTDKAGLLGQRGKI
ncbi:tRNA 2-thiouridine(34) synthase MnmA [Chloroflexota bacterium]